MYIVRAKQKAFETNMAFERPILLAPITAILKIVGKVAKSNSQKISIAILEVSIK